MNSNEPKRWPVRCARITVLLALLIPRMLVGQDVPATTSNSAPFDSRRIEVPEGLVVELAAGPPLVAHPTFATFDDRGRLFVSETAGLNLSSEELEAQLPNSVLMLEDTDGDGRFDRRSVFADRMTFPMGGAWYRDALYVASPPYIWRLEDTNGDGIADRREVLVSKFGYTGNAASIHGCILGPDGRLYWCDGYHGHEFRDAEGQVTSKREGSYIFSCRADGSDVRLHCGGGMDNPVEVDFTEEGELLGTVNILYTRPRVDCLVHWLYGGAYPHRERVLSEIKVTGDLLGPVHRFGHVAVSGVARYRSGVLDPTWRNSFFTTFFNRGKVVRVELEREGATFRATQREFLSCDSRDFHPTDVVEDADGSLLVVDTGGWFYRGCPTSQFAKPDVLGAIYRVRRAEMPKAHDPRGREINWKKLSPRELTALLSDPRFAVRDRAVAECAARSDVLDALRETLSHADLTARRNAVWALTRMVGTPAASTERLSPHATNAAYGLLRRALDDPRSEVRNAACRALATYPDGDSLDLLVQRLHDASPAVRREASTALGRLGDPRAVPALLEALGRDGPPMDRTEEHALIYALIEIDAPQATRKGLESASLRARRGALIALDQMPSGDLAAKDVVPLTGSDDLDLSRAAAQIFSRHAAWSDSTLQVLENLRKHVGDPRWETTVASSMRSLASRAVGDERVAAWIGSQWNDAHTPVVLRNVLLAAIGDGQAVPLHPSWREPLRRLLHSEKVGDVEQAVRILSSVDTDEFRDTLEKLAADAGRSVRLRVAAWEAASRRRGSLGEPAFNLLLDTLSHGAPMDVAQAAQIIGTSTLNKSQLLRLAPHLTTASPAQLPDLVRPFERTMDAEVAAAFLAAMRDAPSLTSLPPHQFSDVILRFPRDLLPEANLLLEKINRAEQEKLKRLDRLLPMLAKGNAAHGRELFFSEKAKCATCHRIGDQGARIGPDLTTIGANRSPQDLLESIVFPSATIVRDYEPYTVMLVDGRVLTGLVARETQEAVFLQQQTGDPIPLRRDEIEQISPSTVSLMPNGLDQALTEAELADVVAFLMSLKLPAVAVTVPASQSPAAEPR